MIVHISVHFVRFMCLRDRICVSVIMVIIPGGGGLSRTGTRVRDIYLVCPAYTENRKGRISARPDPRREVGLVKLPYRVRGIYTGRRGSRSDTQTHIGRIPPGGGKGGGVKPKTGKGGQALVSQHFRWCDFNTSRRERWARESGHSSTRYRRQWQWYGTGYEAVAQQHSVRERRQHGSEAVTSFAEVYPHSSTKI